MKIESLYNEFNHEILGIEYAGIFPKVGNIAYRSYQGRLFTYEIKSVSEDNSIITLKNPLTMVIIYAKFQTNSRSQDKGHFCLATKKDDKFYCWTKYDMYGGHGHIVSFSNFTDEDALKKSLNPLQYAI